MAEIAKDAAGQIETSCMDYNSDVYVKKLKKESKGVFLVLFFRVCFLAFFQYCRFLGKQFNILC